MQLARADSVQSTVIRRPNNLAENLPLLTSKYYGQSSIMIWKGESRPRRQPSTRRGRGDAGCGTDKRTEQPPWESALADENAANRYIRRSSEWGPKPWLSGHCACCQKKFRPPPGRSTGIPRETRPIDAAKRRKTGIDPNQNRPSRPIRRTRRPIRPWIVVQQAPFDSDSGRQ